MNILEANWLVIDTETTGIDTATCHIVELGIVPFHAGEPGPRMGTLINPRVPIPPEASAIHGITDEAVADAPILIEVDERFLARVRDADLIVGYNIGHFDAPLLARAIGPRWTEAVGNKPIIDPLVMIRVVGKWWKGSGRHKLTAVCERFDIPVPPNAHRATADCIMTGRLLWHLLTTDESWSRDAYELAAHLEPLAAQQRADLDAYWAAKNREDKP